MNWYKIETDKGKDGTYHYVGSSELSPQELTKKVEHGFLIQLDDLLYMDRGAMKEWSEWDKSLIPTAYINSKGIIAIMQFKGDPREKYGKNE